MSASGGNKAIIAAFFANLGIAIAKFVGFLITGASSMLSEAIHSVADTGNQALLLLGRKQADKDADEEHQFGYGRERFFWAFVVAVVLFALGSVFAIYEGIHKIQHPEELTSPAVAIGILGVRHRCSRASRCGPPCVESNQLRGDDSWWGFIRHSRVPELPVVLLEDFGAMIGLVIALGAWSLSVVDRQRRVRRHRLGGDRADPGCDRRRAVHRDEEPADRRAGAPRGPQQRSAPPSRPRPSV